MAKEASKTATDYIVSLNVNGLAGRMLSCAPTTKRKRDILMVYDQHASLERWWPLAQELRRYGQVTMPDLPGFGGMRSFYKINRKPSIDSLAGYLAAFIKLRYKRKSVTIVGIGLGFAVVTRMLQQYPDLRRKVNLLIAIDGFAHHEDFKLSTSKRLSNKLVSQLFVWHLPAIFFRNIFLHPGLFRLRQSDRLRAGRYELSAKRLKRAARAQAIKTNIKLWRRNDVRTFMATSNELLHLDNCGTPLKLHLWHITSKNSSLYDRFKTDQHLKVIYPKVHHAPSAITNYAAVGILPIDKQSKLLPPKIRSQLSKT